MNTEDPMNILEPVRVVTAGDACTFVDSVGKQHDALVTAVHGPFYDTPVWTEEQANEFYNSVSRPDYYSEDEWEQRKANLVGHPHTIPSINVVYVSDNENERDPYGLQILRQTSVPHKQLQSAHGFSWF